MAKPTIQHQQQAQEFSLTTPEGSGELAYSRPSEHIIDFTHTYLDETLRGTGLAEELARQALAHARAAGLRVKTSCAFMKHFVEKHHAEYADLLA